MASRGLAPALLGQPSRWPGGFALVEMEYLDPEEGWMQVRQPRESVRRYTVTATSYLSVPRAWNTMLSNMRLAATCCGKGHRRALVCLSFLQAHHRRYWKSLAKSMLCSKA